MSGEQTIWPVILSGGSGTRLWPMSRESYPKQFLPLAGKESLLQETVRRVSDNTLFQPPVIVCNSEHRFMVAQQIRETGNAPSAIILEPVGRNTAPAVAVAADIIARKDKNAVLLVLPSDHVIRDTKEFHRAIQAAIGAALQGNLVTFGIRPEGPETGYGYIRRGAPLPDGAEGFEIEAFVEKPDLATAESYLADGRYDWNSGMFLFHASRYLEVLSELEPEIAEASGQAVADSKTDLDFIRLDENAFGSSPSKSIDYAVMEHAKHRAVIPVDIGWNDVGSWSALLDIANKDGAGNCLTGNVVSLETTNSYVRSDGPVVTTLGVDDLVVVATSDAVLIMPGDRTQDVRTIVDALKLREIDAATSHPRVYRPWGYYETVDEGERFQVKRITVNIGASLSLQQHHHRAEHWIVVNGTAKVRRGEDEFVLNENESTYIPPNTLHRLENPGKVPLNLIEVQSGGYLGEDDIVRYDDDYGRN